VAVPPNDTQVDQVFEGFSGLHTIVIGGIVVVVAISLVLFFRLYMQTLDHVSNEPILL